MTTPHVRLALLVAFLLVAPSARAEDSKSESAPAPTRELRVGLTATSLVQDPFPTVEGMAPGMLASYEFLLSDSFAVALALSYRRYNGDPSLHQLGYGALLRHEILDIGTQGSHLYASYGLLLQVSSIQGEEGSGTSHDSRLTLGSDFHIGGAPLYAEASYHFSRLRFLNVDSRNLDYWEFGLGWRYAW
ncbi:MAG: hypothetical protein IT285_06505 [Bdellovibrionales bacterium]|nr:hypothetical protein [Bdellovibrionales bacterium]